MTDELFSKLPQNRYDEQSKEKKRAKVSAFKLATNPGNANVWPRTLRGLQTVHYWLGLTHSLCRGVSTTTYMCPSWPLLAPRAQRCQWSHSGQPWSRHSSSSCCIAADQATMLTDRVHIQVWDLSPRTAAPYLEGAAGAGLAQPDDAVQIVGGDALVLLLDETKCGEVEAGLLALSVFQHRGQLVDGAPVSRRQASWGHVLALSARRPFRKESRDRIFWLTRQTD